MRRAPHGGRAAEAVETGVFGANAGQVPTEIAPFAGIEQSGLGCEGSRHGVEDDLELKYIRIGLSDPQLRPERQSSSD